MENDTKEMRVGVGVIIFKDGKILLGKRKSLNKTDGYYQFSGGRMDKAGEPICVEPDKCEGWEWYSLDDLPSPIFLITQAIIDVHQSGEVYIEV